MRYPKLTTGALWTTQAILAALFLFAGVMKLAMPVEVLEEQAQMNGLFLQFIGVCEVLGALGVVLPAATRVLPWLTPLAAAGLVAIMLGATGITLAGPDAALAAFPAVTGVLAAFVAYGRWRLAPRAARRATALQPA